MGPLQPSALRAAFYWPCERGVFVGGALVQMLPPPPFQFLKMCLDDGHELVKRADHGPALCTLNDAVPDGGAMDCEIAGAALTTLQKVVVFAPRHRSIGEQSSKDRPRSFDKIVCSAPTVHR